MLRLSSVFSEGFWVRSVGALTLLLGVSACGGSSAVNGVSKCAVVPVTLASFEMPNGRLGVLDHGLQPA
ncbi:MAG TPA: hypothetical protein VHW01_14290 [Polyangiaceae bacterium]|jgi:hypothetical protein|nr:hypothetical protein [Polyangiaceae bacterium]